MRLIPGSSRCASNPGLLLPHGPLLAVAAHMEEVRAVAQTNVFYPPSKEANREADLAQRC
jgi:hypothetical protein